MMRTLEEVTVLPRKARMRDVATLAGVATMTVSRVLNNSAPVTEETRRRVHQAIKQLSYRPNPVARSLRRAKSKSIGIIVPNFYDQFFAGCAHAISLVAKKYGYSVSVTTSDEDARNEFTEASMMVLNHVEGLAVIPAAIGRSRLDRPEFHATHIVTLDRPIKGRRFNSVLVENERGSCLAVEHLIEHGHRNICYLGLSEKLFTIKARHDGFVQAMKQAGLNTMQYFDCNTQGETYAVLQRALNGGGAATALFVSNNFAMQHVLHALSRLKVRVPEEVALVGFDDFEMADIFNPALTVVRQPSQELGRVAAELLFSRLRDETVAVSGQQIVLPVELIIRQSCGCNGVRGDS